MKSIDFVKTWGITSTSDQVDRNPGMPDFKANHYKVVLRIKANGKVRQFTTHFSKGYGLNGRPTAAEVLECLAGDVRGLQDSQSFEDWAAEYGYDTDSREAERVYKTVEKQSEGIATWLFHPKAWQNFLTLEDN